MDRETASKFIETSARMALEEGDSRSRADLFAASRLITILAAEVYAESFGFRRMTIAYRKLSHARIYLLAQLNAEQTHGAGGSVQ